MTNGEEQKARMRRIMGGTVAQLLAEMGIEDIDLQAILSTAFDGEPESTFEDFGKVPDETLRGLCRKLAIETMPRELREMLPS